MLMRSLSGHKSELLLLRICLFESCVSASEWWDQGFTLYVNTSSWQFHTTPSTFSLPSTWRIAAALVSARSVLVFLALLDKQPLTLKPPVSSTALMLFVNSRSSSSSVRTESHILHMHVFSFKTFAAFRKSFFASSAVFRSAVWAIAGAGLSPKVNTVLTCSTGQR